MNNRCLHAICLLLGCLSLSAQKPKVWIYTDMSDQTLPGSNHMGTVNDPDDISAMAGYLLMANQFETVGIVVASTHRKAHQTSPDQAAWATSYLGEAYRREVPNLNRQLGGYPADITFTQSCIKESGERFDPAQAYASLDKYPTVQALFDTVKNQHEVVYVLCWGSLTEPAILVKHAIETQAFEVLNKLCFVAHWTNSSLHQGTQAHPEAVANCREDARACAFLKEIALRGDIQYHECGAIGQHGIVSGAPKGDAFFDQFRVSELGTLFVSGKYVKGRVDHSDAATYWALLGTWGVSLGDMASNGTNDPKVEAANEHAFRSASPNIHHELLRRAVAASEH